YRMGGSDFQHMNKVTFNPSHKHKLLLFSVSALLTQFFLANNMLQDQLVVQCTLVVNNVNFKSIQFKAFYSTLPIECCSVLSFALPTKHIVNELTIEKNCINSDLKDT